MADASTFALVPPIPPSESNIPPLIDDLPDLHAPQRIELRADRPFRGASFGIQPAARCNTCSNHRRALRTPRRCCRCLLIPQATTRPLEQEAAGQVPKPNIDR